MKKLLFALLLGVCLIACNKNKSQCNVEPEKVNIRLISESVAFTQYDESSNLFIKFLPDKDALDSFIALMGIGLMDSVSNTSNIVSLTVLFNTPDTGIAGSFSVNDLDGILFYIRANVNEPMRTIVYRRQQGGLIYDTYLSTEANAVAFNHIKLLSKLTSNGADNNLKLSFIRAYEGLLDNEVKHYAEFYERMQYTWLNNGTGNFLNDQYDCGTPCWKEKNAQCLPVESAQYRCFGDCGQSKGLQIATPINYSAGDCEDALEEQRNFRDNVLLRSRKGVEYTALYYYVGAKLGADFYVSHIDLMFDVVFHNVLPMIARVNDDSYTGVLYTNSDLGGFINVIEALKSKFHNDAVSVEKLNALKQDLINKVNTDKQTLLTEFYAY